ncbi:MAG: hypothetical protein AB7O48_02160 [Cyclobacteriaceae bacterium]
MKGRIPHLVSLLNERLQRFDRSRNIQWKLNASIWGGIVVTIGFLLTQKFRIPCVALLIVSVAIAIIHWGVIKNIQSALDWDKKLIQHYHDLINEKIDKDGRLQKFMDHNNTKSSDWKVIQISVTIGLLTLSMLFLCDIKCIMCGINFCCP